MLYVYEKEDCPACVKKKAELKAAGKAFQIRSSLKISRPEDDIDLEALVQASMQNMTLPVIFEYPVPKTV